MRKSRRRGRSYEQDGLKWRSRGTEEVKTTEGLGGVTGDFCLAIDGFFLLDDCVRGSGGQVGSGMTRHFYFRSAKNLVDCDGIGGGV